MKKYYRINIYSEDIDMEKYNKSIVVEKGLLYAKEVVTNTKIMICDNKMQGSMYDYYVLSSDFKLENIVRYEKIKKYIESFKLSMFPIYSNLESKQVKRLLKQKWGDIMLNSNILKNIENKDPYLY